MGIRKKSGCAAFAAIAGILLAACAGKGEAVEEEAVKTVESEVAQERPDETEKRSSTETQEAEESRNFAEAESESEAQTDNAPGIEIEIEPLTLPDSEALAFVKNMKVGWNLGNTFDAVDHNGLDDELLYESCWNGVITTKEMIDTLKDAGFETIRIPVSWHNHVAKSAEGYVISEPWMNRVQEVVDYAIDDGLYVIINIHHDFSEEYIYPTEQYLEQSKKYVTDVWTQIAERFQDYDEHLIMESLNEPRLVGTSSEWWLDIRKEECVEAVRCINELNQTFVDVVRSGGGKNATRYLMVPGYAASLAGATNSYFELPQDNAQNENKILVSVHAYTPYAFALQAASERGSTDSFSMDSKSSTKDIDDLMDDLYRTFIQNGTGVVIGEFGAREKDGNTQARAEFTAYYIEAARARGITCCWWDNNAFTGDGENFGLFRRRAMSFLYPEILQSMMEHCE